MHESNMNNDQLIVITGALGFIGSGVVRYLNDQGFSNLLLVDNFQKKAKWKNLVGKEFVDIIPKEDLFKYLMGRDSEIQAFIHLGACSDTTETDADYLIENNYRYSMSLAEYAFQNDHRFIYASSAATYGDGTKGFVDDHKKLQDLEPLNMYGFSKHLFDLWLLRENLLEKAIGLKFFNVFGPNENHKEHMASMIFKMAHIAKEGKTIQLFKSNDPNNFADGEQVRDFIYVKDAVKMTCDLLEKSFEGASGIFNIGSGRTVSWNHLAKALFKSVGKEANIRYIDMPESLSKQYQNYTKADMTKFFSLFSKGKKSYPMTSIEDAVDEYVKEYLLTDRRW